MEVKIYRINESNPLPSQANENDAGYDVYVSKTTEFFPDQILLVPLGIIAQAPNGFHFKLCLRSSMGFKRGFTMPNSVGIIDSAYSGANDEIKIMLKAPSWETMKHKNIKEEDLIIEEGERVGQLILEQNNKIEWVIQEDRNFAGKSRGGFGSSGK